MTDSPDFDRIVYFGDSLSDTGLFFDLSSAGIGFGIPISPPYAQQFSDGAVHSEIAPELLNVDSESYAIGSGRLLGSRMISDVLGVPPLNPALATDINLTAQVDRLLADTAGQDLSDTAVSLLIGLNDLNNFTPSSFDPVTVAFEVGQLLAAMTETLSAQVARLAAAGVGQINLMTIPDPSFFPGFNFIPAELQAAAPLAFTAYNTAIEGIAAAFGDTVRVLDLEALTDEIEADPSAFGFLTIELSLYAEFPSAAPPMPILAGTGIDPEQVGFMDFLHPSEAMHGLWAIWQATELTTGVEFLGDGFDIEIGGKGVQTVFGGAGHDVLWLGKDDDAGFGGLDDDLVAGGRGNDIVGGGSGDDIVKGGRGDDVVAGNAGDDWLKGGRGNDLIIDGLGSDHAWGGKGDDVFLWAEAALIGGAPGDMDHFVGGKGEDTLLLWLTAETRAMAEAAVAAGGDPGIAGLEISGIESIVFLDEWEVPDLDALEDVRVAEADLWGLV